MGIEINDLVQIKSEDTESIFYVGQGKIGRVKEIYASWNACLVFFGKNDVLPGKEEDGYFQILPMTSFILMKNIKEKIELPEV